MTFYQGTQVMVQMALFLLIWGFLGLPWNWRCPGGSVPPPALTSGLPYGFWFQESGSIVLPRMGWGSWGFWRHLAPLPKNAKWFWWPQCGCQCPIEWLGKPRRPQVVHTYCVPEPEAGGLRTFCFLIVTESKICLLFSPPYRYGYLGPKRLTYLPKAIYLVTVPIWSHGLLNSGTCSLTVTLA